MHDRNILGRGVLAGLLLMGLANLRAADAPLVVGTRHVPPFAIVDENGEWTGLSIDLWREAARQLSLDFTIRELTTPDSLVQAVANGDVDLSIAAITVTPGREEQVDFSYPYFSSGLGIVVPASRESGWRGLIQAVISIEFLSVVAALSLVLLGAGFGVWFFERKQNPEQFGGPPIHGLGSAFWWSAVTMTTVGYGDKAPRTLGGRLVALVWMFTSVIIISGFTAQIASSLTLDRLASEISGPADLPRFTVSTVNASSAATFLEERGVTVAAYANIAAALDAVRTGRADACVYDAAILQYEIRNDGGRLTMLDRIFEEQSYGVALPLGSDLRKPLNVTLLELTESDYWGLLRQNYLGVSD